MTEAVRLLVLLRSCGNSVHKVEAMFLDFAEAQQTKQSFCTKQYYELYFP